MQTKRSGQRFHALLTNRALLERLCQLQARAAVMQYLLPGEISARMIADIYAQVNGCCPRQGQLPQEIGVFFSSAPKRLQASIAVSAFERLGDVVSDFALRYVYTYDAYAQTFPTPTYDFNRVWFLLRQYQLGRIRRTNCRACNAQYVYNAENVLDKRQCPVCALTKGRRQSGQSRGRGNRTTLESVGGSAGAGRGSE